MIPMLFAAAMHASPVVITQNASAPPARYVRIKMKLNAYGIDGSAQILVDREDARYSERFDAGPVSFSQGFDGTQAWQADVNGTSAVQGNAFDRGMIVAWGYLFASPRPATVMGSTVYYADVSQPARLRFDPATNRVQRFTLFNGSTDEFATFSAYRAFGGGITAPSSIAFTDDNGTWTGRVTSVEAISSAPASDFAPPAHRNDASIAGGVTSVPFLTATAIVIPVRINNGPVMHFILDTGGQNVLLAPAVKQLHLHTVGHGSVGGAGAGVIPTSFAMVRSMRVGNAEIRDQPFLIFDTPILKGIDGIVGFELLSRFAARIDCSTNTLTLASSLPPSWVAGVPATPFSYRSRQPQVAGAIDGLAGALTIDTGNSGVIDVNSPFARQHNLWARYHAMKPKRGALIGVGGSVRFANITIRQLQIGTATLHDVHGDLTDATSGIEAHPGFAANVGVGVFRNYTFVLDYPHENVYFAPGGIEDMSGVLFARDGNRIVVSKVRTGFAKRAGVREGMVLRRLNGKPVAPADLGAVEASLRGRPGSTVDLVFGGDKHVKLLLVNYL